jgi:AraC-like DNA-binding protein
VGTLVSLDHFPAKSRFHHFRDIVNELYVPVTVTSEAPQAFRYSRSEKLLGDLSFVSGMMTKVMFTRTARDVVGAECDDNMKLVVPLAGSVVFRQNKREALVKPGQFYLDDAARPYEKRVIDSLTYLTVNFPRDAVASRLGGLDSILAIGFGTELPHSRLARDFLLSIATVWDSIEETSAAHLSSVASDLIMAALWERCNPTGTPQSVYRSAQFQQARAFIYAHLDDPRLSPSMIATALGVSTRYLRYLFSERRFSYRRYVLAERLARCAKDLGDPRLAHRTITAVAYSWAFFDGAHFSRAFKAAFEMSPRAYRALKLPGNVVHNGA